jgi:hypothetical protein
MLTQFNTYNVRRNAVLCQQLLVAANFVSSTLIPFTLMIVISSSETSVVTTDTLRHIIGNGTLHSRSREILKTFIALTGWTV